MCLNESDRPKLTAITGGIGSGKSVVCRILREIGCPVYDCDSEAKRLMACDPEVIDRLSRSFPEAYDDKGVMDRGKLSAIVFSHPDRLKTLNGIVHGAVRRDLAQWVAKQNVSAFVETAILYESELDRMVDEVWVVEAPVDLRVRRVIARNGMTAEQVMARINAQNSHEPDRQHPVVRHIVNDGNTPLLEQILTLL